MADLNNPRFWQQIYSPPSNSNTHSGGASSSAEMEDGDLEATLDPAALRAAETALDHGAIAALVETMVKERIAAMLASGQIGALGTVAPSAPALQPAPPRTPPPVAPPPVAPVAVPGRRPAPPARTPTSPGLRAVPRQPTSPGLRAVPGRLSSPGLRAVSAPPSARTPRPSQPALRTIERPGSRETASPSPPPPGRGSTPSSPRSTQGSPRSTPGSPRPTPAPQRSKPDAPSSVGAAMWDRTPMLPGGASSLLTASGLTQEAISVLVMVNGNTTLRGLRTLVPQLDDAAFLGIIRDAVKRGVLELA